MCPRLPHIANHESGGSQQRRGSVGSVADSAYGRQLDKRSIAIRPTTLMASGEFSLGRRRDVQFNHLGKRFGGRMVAVKCTIMRSSVGV